jgi:hypothetical protein
MPDHDLHPLGHILVGDRNRLFRITGVIAHQKLDLLAHQAAPGIQLGGGEFGAALHLVTENGVGTGYRAIDREGDVRPGGAGQNEGRRGGQCAEA